TTSVRRGTLYTSLLLVALCCGVAVGQPDTSDPMAGDVGWLQFGGDATATRSSPLTQITSETVGRLTLAWATELGFTGRVQGSPAAWQGRLFVSTEHGVLALDAVSGAQLWYYTESAGQRTNTGLPVQAPRGSPAVVPGDAAGGIVVASLPNAPAVVALDVDDGSLVWRTDVGDPDFSESLRTNPLLAGDILVVGPTGADLSPVPGRLVGLRLEDGAVAWTFDLVPVDEADPARATWSPYPPGRRFGVGGGSAWNSGAYDPVSGLVVYGTGQPFPS